MKFLSIAVNVFSEARHNKVLHIAGGFAAILILFALFLGEVSLQQNVKVIKDIGMATISVFGIFVAIYIGVNSLFKELEQRTIYTVVSKPIYRYEILLGKYLGMMGVTAAVVFLMTMYLYVILFFVERNIDLKLLPAISLILAEIWIISAIAILFSSFSTPFLSGFFTAGIFLIGRVSHELGRFGQRSQNDLFRLFATSIQKVFDLKAFNLRTEVVHGFSIYRPDFFYPLAYAFFLILLSLLAAFFFFRRRDFK